LACYILCFCIIPFLPPLLGLGLASLIILVEQADTDLVCLFSQVTRHQEEYAEVEEHLGRLGQRLSDTAREMSQTGLEVEGAAAPADAEDGATAAAQVMHTSAAPSATPSSAPTSALPHTPAATPRKVLGGAADSGSAASSPAGVAASPGNAADFWRRFERVLEATAEVSALLYSVPPSRLRSYLNNQLEPDHVAAIVPGLGYLAQSMAESSGAATAAAEAYKRLRALTRTPRLDIALGLLDDEALAAVARSANDVCDAVLQHVPDKVKPDEVAQVRQRFCV
jgi:hypothetical protein